MTEAAAEFPPILHHSNGDLHGPVSLIVSDDGKLALHCHKDGASWKLPDAKSVAKPTVAATVGTTTESASRKTKKRPTPSGDLARMRRVADDLLRD
ncbi:hypothetical protein [Gordonia iterans]